VKWAGVPNSNTGGPVVLASDVRHVPLTYDPQRPDLDPTSIPAESLVEAEPGDWWTIGRRIRLGRAAAPLLAAEDRETYAIGALPPPYDRLAREVDGQAVFAAGLLAGDPIWAEVPVPLADRWSPAELTYRATFQADGAVLRIDGHDGGDVDWYSADGGSADDPAVPAVRREVIPSRLDYPGAPLPRWWQIEDRAVDIGGYAPDRSHFASMLLLDAVLAHSDDWFGCHIPAPEGASSLLRRADFRRTYVAVAVSELGDAFQYIALMWFALVAGGPLGVIAVRLADSIPALLFGLHGGVVADRWDRRRVMISADLVRGIVLVPVAIAGLSGHLPLAMLVAAAFVLTAAASYFDPAYGGLLPELVDRRNVQ